MTQMTIGETSASLGLTPSAVRYYERRGLVTPRREAGRRVFGRDDLRRLAFLRLAQHLGIELAVIGAIMDEEPGAWREAVGLQIRHLDDLITRAQDAQALLDHALSCPADHPAAGCPAMTGALDDLAAGATIQSLATTHARMHGRSAVQGGREGG